MEQREHDGDGGVANVDDVEDGPTLSEAEDRELEQLVGGAFREVEAGLAEPRARVMAALACADPPRRPAAGAPSAARESVEDRILRPRAARFRRWFLAVNAIAASLLLVAWVSYAALVRAQRLEVAAVQTRIEVKNLAFALKTYQERQQILPMAGNESMVAALSAPATSGRPEPYYPFLEGQLERSSGGAGGLYRDAFGNPFRYEPNPDGTALVYSVGGDGRDDRGVGGDDIACLVR